MMHHPGGLLPPAVTWHKPKDSADTAANTPNPATDDSKDDVVSLERERARDEQMRLLSYRKARTSRAREEAREVSLFARRLFLQYRDA